MRIEMTAPAQSNIRAGDVTRAIFCHAASYGNIERAKALAQHRGMSSAVVNLLSEKGTANWTLTITPALQVSFLEGVAPFSAFDRMAADGAFRNVPLNTAVGTTTLGFLAAERVPTEPIVLGSLSLTTSPVERREVACMCVVTRELMNATSSESFFANELRKGVGKATDAVFIPSLISTGTPDDTAADLPAAIGKVLAGLATTSASRVYLFMSPLAAKTACGLMSVGGGAVFPGMTPVGGAINNVAVLVSDAVDQDELLAVDANEIAANIGSIQVDASDEASVAMLTNPALGPAQLESMFGTNSVATRCIRELGFKLLKIDAVSRVTVDSLAAS